MPPAERAKRLSRSLQTYFRIDLFSALVERDFERRLAEAILDAERDAFRRGQEAALGLAPRDRLPAPRHDTNGLIPTALNADLRPCP